MLPNEAEAPRPDELEAMKARARAEMGFEGGECAEDVLTLAAEVERLRAKITATRAEAARREHAFRKWAERAEREREEARAKRETTEVRAARSEKALRSIAESGENANAMFARDALAAPAEAEGARA